MDPTNNIRLVLQGEIALVDGNKNPDVKILTSIPMTCTVFTLYDKSSKVGGLAHLDSYTNMVSIVNKIQRILDKKFGKTIADYQFEARVCGGLKEYKISQEQQKALLLILDKLNICYEILDLPDDIEKRKQLQFDVSEGKLEEKAPNKVLEYLQQREFGDWEEAFKKGAFSPPASNEREKDERGLFKFKIREAKRDASILDKLKEQEIFPSTQQVDEILQKVLQQQLNETEKSIIQIHNEIESIIVKANFFKHLRSPFSSGSWYPPIEEDGLPPDEDQIPEYW